jgi:hypothetical protein
MDIHVRTKESETSAAIDQYPDTCPHCHYAGTFRQVYAAVDYLSAYLSFYCPRNDCGRYFVYEYDVDRYGEYHLMRPISGTPVGVDYSQTIVDISSTFVDIFEQAEAAENFGLKDICGVGYRKALEFLIKDYIILNDSSLKTNVENKQLSACIADHIFNPTIKDIARRAVWLGNDETHYVRKWEGMDISHLKQLIALTVHWIETEEMTKQMISSMPDAKK